MLTPLARGNVERGVEVETTREHVNREANRKSCVSHCPADMIKFVLVRVFRKCLSPLQQSENTRESCN